jgi:hypothetical protein
MKITFPVAILLMSTGLSFAQDANRYSLEKTTDGYVRMDKSTGEMSICKQQGDQLICRVAADDRVALEDGITRLEARLTKIEEKLAAMEKSGATSKTTLPTDEEFEKTIGYMEKFFRRFMGVVQDLNKQDLNEDEGQLKKTWF